MTTITIPEAEPLTMNWNPDAISFLIYGQSGTYKTPAVAQWPKPIVYIDTDNGMLSLISLLDDLTDIYRVEIKDKQDHPTGYAGPVGWLTVMAVLESIAKTGYYGVRNKIFPKTVVLDTLTSASKYALNHILFKNNHVNQNPTQPDWGQQMGEIEKALTYGLSLNAHFICVAHEQLIEDKLSGRVWLLPVVTGKMAFNIDNKFSEVYHAKASVGVDGKPLFQFETRGTPLMRGKSRMGVPPLISAGFTDIEKRITELNQKTSLLQGSQKGGPPSQTTTQPPSATQQTSWTKQP